MRRCYNIKRFGILSPWFYISYLLFFATMSAFGQAVPDPPDSMPPVSPDSVFIEIHITPDGAYGVTPDGRELDYNFTTGEFEEAVLPSTTRRVFGRQTREPKDETVPDMLSELEELELERQVKDAEARRKLMEAKRLTGLKFGTIIVEEDETVRGPLVAVGNIIVRGEVEGDVISYKRITVTSTGKITGDARAPDIVKMRGGVIEGNRIEMNLPPLPEVPVIVEEGSNIPLIVTLSIFASLLLCGMLAVAVVGKPVRRIRDCLFMSFVKSFFVGLLFWFAFGPLIALFALTIIGIPVAFIVLPLATFFGALLGVIGLSQLVGEKTAGLFGGPASGQFRQVIYGITILQLLWIIMSILMKPTSSVTEGFATLFLVIAIVVWSIGITAGVGAVILTRFGSRDCPRPGTVAPGVEQPPPPPTPPPLKSDE